MLCGSMPNDPKAEKAALDGPFDKLLGQNAEDLSNMFCSELVAEAYQQIGLLADGLPSNEYVPGDFASTAKTPLVLGQGYVLGNEIEI